HHVVLKADGTVAAWGDNTWGQCWVPEGLSNVIAVAAGGDHSLALTQNGTLIAWGDKSYGMDVPPPGLTNVVGIAAGLANNLALCAGPAITASPSNVVAALGSAVTFSVSAEANGPLTH